MSALAAIQQLGRAMLLGLVRLILPARSRDPLASAGEIRKVLLVRVDPRLGNVLLTTPLARALKTARPHIELHWLVSSRFADAIRGLPFVDRVIPFDKRDFFVNPLRFWSLVVAIRRERYDAAIEAAHWHAFSFTNAALTWCSGAPIRIGHERGDAPRFLTHAVRHDPSRTSDVEAKLELLGPLGITGGGARLETTLGSSETEKSELSSALHTAGIPAGRHVAINPGGRKTDHRWAPEGFGDVARRLASAGFVPVVYWGPGEEPIARAVVAASGGMARLAPPTDVRHLAAAFRMSDWVVTNDTGPMHLAAAVGARTVAVMLSEDADRWAHSTPGFFAVRAVDVPGTAAKVAEQIAAHSNPGVAVGR